MSEQEEVIKAVRPLAQTQNRNLIKIIETDYNLLREQVRQFAAEQVVAKKREIRAASSPAMQQQAEDRAQELVRKYMQKRKKLIREAEGWGISLSIPNADVQAVRVSNTKLDRDLTAAEAEINSERDIALSELLKSELQAKRVVYQASVSEAAEAIQNTLPSAEQAMLAAAETRATRELE